MTICHHNNFLVSLFHRNLQHDSHLRITNGTNKGNQQIMIRVSIEHICTGHTAKRQVKN